MAGFVKRTVQGLQEEGSASPSYAGGAGGGTAARGAHVDRENDSEDRQSGNEGTGARGELDTAGPNSNRLYRHLTTPAAEKGLLGC